MTKPTNVLVVASTFPVNDGDPVPAFVRDQVIALKRVRPHLNITVLAPHDFRSPTPSFKKHKYFEEHRFHYMWPNRLELLTGRGIMPALQTNSFNYLLVPPFLIAEYRVMKKLVQKANIDIIYAHWFMPNAVVAARVSRQLDIPLVFTSHSSDIQVMSKLPFGRWIAEKTMEQVSRWTAVSEYTAQKASRLFKPSVWIRYSNKMEVLPMGIDLEKMLKIQPTQITNQGVSSLETAETFLLFIGRLAAVKGVQTLLRAFARLRLNDIKLVIAGDGPERNNLLNLAQDLGVADRTLFVGFVSGEDKYYLMKESKVVILPSTVDPSGQTEGFPVVLIESMALGKVIVASDVSGAQTSIVDGKNGYIFRHDDVEELAEKIQTCLALDKPSVTRVRNYMRRLASQYDWRVVAEKHAKFLFESSG